MSWLHRRGTEAVSIDDLLDESPRPGGPDAAADLPSGEVGLVRRARDARDAAATEACSIRREAEEHADRIRADAKLEAGHIVEDATVWGHTWRNRVRMLSDQLVTAANSAAWRVRGEAKDHAGPEAEAVARGYVGAEVERSEDETARGRAAAIELLSASRGVCRAVAATGADLGTQLAGGMSTARRVGEELQRLVEESSDPDGGP